MNDDSCKQQPGLRSRLYCCRSGGHHLRVLLRNCLTCCAVRCIRRTAWPPPQGAQQRGRRPANTRLRSVALWLGYVAATQTLAFYHHLDCRSSCLSYSRPVAMRRRYRQRLWQWQLRNRSQQPPAASRHIGRRRSSCAKRCGSCACSCRSATQRSGSCLQRSPLSQGTHDWWQMPRYPTGGITAAGSCCQ